MAVLADPQPPLGDLRLAATKDVKKFRRVHEKTPLVARGPRGSWDEALLVTTAIYLAITPRQR